MKKRIIIISSIIILSIVIVGIYSTFATDEASISNNTYDFILSENNGEITVPAGSSKTVIYKVTNTNRGKVRYGVSYFGENISVKVYEDSSDDITGYIDYGETKFIKLYIDNSSNSDSTVTIKTALGYEDGGELEGTPAVPSGYVLVSEVYVPVKGVTLVDYLTNLYLDANPSKSTVANNGINYYYAPGVSMMNDGMNSSNVWEDGANTGNIRYYGATPNNYIDIGDRDASGNVIPWRIIGVFKNMKLADGSTDTLVKVVRSEPLSSYMQWDDNSNDWHNATLQTYLNTGNYYTGLSQDVKDKIADVEWNLGGWEDPEVYSNFVYEKERGSNKCSSCTYNSTWNGKIALMYPSDYGYAADLTKCNENLYYYDDSTCVNSNWMFKVLITGENDCNWFLTPNSANSDSVWYVHYSSGYVFDGYNDLDLPDLVSPTLYLKSDVIKEAGDGSKRNPYSFDPKQEKKEFFVDYLTNLYMNANPSQATVANNGINYYYAESVSMMNDGMGSNHTWEDGVNAGNIRYYGQTPPNYIDIGDRDASGNVVPWRIIGVFKNMKFSDGATDTLIKVIRDESVCDMAWDDNSNDWNNATLKIYLNEGEYYTSLSQEVKNKIAKVEWNLGGYDDTEIFSNDIYKYERGNLKADNSFQSVWEGNIALMYPSDYGYAADLTKCSKTLYEYETDTTNCTSTDWLFNGDYQWLITPDSSDSNIVWNIYSDGFVDNYLDVYDGNSMMVSPVLYLKSNLIYDSGDGTSIESAYVVK